MIPRSVSLRSTAFYPPARSINMRNNWAIRKFFSPMRVIDDVLGVPLGSIHTAKTSRIL